MITQGTRLRKAEPSQDKGENKESEQKEKEEEITSIKTFRSNFNAVAKFAPSVLTDKSGNVAIDVEIPHNLTRYRYSPSSLILFFGPLSSVISLIPLPFFL